MSKRLVPQFVRSFSVGAIPFLGQSMTYQVTEDDSTDETKPDTQQRTAKPESNDENLQENLDLPSTPVFARSKSDLNMANNDTISNSPTTSSGYVDPRTLGYSSTRMVPMARPLPDRTRRAVSILPPVPPRSSRDSDIIAHRRANSESNPYDISKSIAESAMDISLLTANANQLRLLITYNQGSQTYLACITFIIMSLVLQMLVAVTMIIVSLMKQSLRETTRQKLKIITSVGVAIITMINILVASLVVAEAPNVIPMTTSAGTLMMMETMPTTFTAASTTSMPPTTSSGTIGISTSTVSSTVETLLDGGLTTLAASLLTNVTGT
ncbi:uncharacterized protein LOC134217111 [Armigeres subalbatus]|uniref:uncharacterized protein LOC134217111 n=1 Tax=Armigeres subalbatus TaxID=124917 RepID=UPI002ED1B030